MNVVTATTSPLLQPLSSYPDVYLATRLVPRLTRRYAARDVQSLSDDDFSWKVRNKEIVWSYMQLSERLRRQCEPLYAFLQAPILLAAMRFSASGHQERAAQLLKGSLWNERIRRSVSAELDAQRQFSVLCQQLSSYGWQFEAATPAEGHPHHGAEKELYRALLGQLRRQRAPEPLRNLGAALHDLYNLAQCRYISDWPANVAPLSGGRLPAKAYRSLSHLKRAVTSHYGPGVGNESDAEQHLRLNYAKNLKQRARIGGVQEKLFAFLWSVFILPESRAAWQQQTQEQR